MSPASVTSTVLAVLEEHEPNTALSAREIVARVGKRYEGQNRIPNANEIRGRLSKLHKEGVVTRPERGQYMLVQTTPNETTELAELVRIVSGIVRQDAFRRTILWDATPFLQLAEDGGPGRRLVVEHEHASSIRDEVAVAWPADHHVATWTAKTTGPLGSMLWEPDNSAPFRTPLGVVFVDREKFGATGVTPQGYRTPFPERILIEFFGDDGPAEATAIVQTMLNDPTIDPERLWQAAENLGEVDTLGIILAGLGDELRPELRTALLTRLPPVANAILSGER